MKIVGLALVRNEEGKLPHFLRALSRVTDAICVLDDASEDRSREIVASLVDECRIERVIHQPLWDNYAERRNRQALLEAGRAVGGTHFVILDADEVFTADLIRGDYLRRQVERLKPGQTLSLRWLNLWRSMKAYRVDGTKWGNVKKRFIFADDGACSYSGPRFHIDRCPTNLGGEQLAVRDGSGVLHYQFADWHSAWVKQAWYRCLERIAYPEKSPLEINLNYGESVSETGLRLRPVHQAWTATYPAINGDTYFGTGAERLATEVRSWFATYGVERFADLDIWDLDWGVEPPARIPRRGDPLRLLTDFAALLRTTRIRGMTADARESLRDLHTEIAGIAEAVPAAVYAAYIKPRFQALEDEFRELVPERAKAASGSKSSAGPRFRSRISVLCPTRGRPDMAVRMCESIISTAADADRVEVLLYVDEDDPALDQYLEQFRYREGREFVRSCVLANGEPIGIARAWNHLARMAQGDVLIMGGDDQTYDDAGWDSRLDEEVAKYPDQIYCMWFNDGHWKDKLCTFPIVSRKWVDTLGYFVPPFFERIYLDTWLMDLAQRVGRLHYVPDVLTEHHHVSYGKGIYDSTYAEQLGPDGSLKPAVRRDMDLFASTVAYRETDARRLAAVMNGAVVLREGLPVNGRSSLA